MPPWVPENKLDVRWNWLVYASMSTVNSWLRSASMLNSTLMHSTAQLSDWKHIWLHRTHQMHSSRQHHVVASFLGDFSNKRAQKQTTNYHARLLRSDFTLCSQASNKHKPPAQPRSQGPLSTSRTLGTRLSPAPVPKPEPAWLRWEHRLPSSKYVVCIERIVWENHRSLKEIV